MQPHYWIFPLLHFIMKKTMLIIFFVLVAIAILAFIVLNRDVFGARPSGARLELIKKSKNYREGKFHNLNPTPSLTEGYSYPSVLYNFFFGKKENVIPEDSIPFVRTNLKRIPKDANALIWFGHSSYWMQVEGKSILVDPVLNDHAAPFDGMNKVFKGAASYTVNDLPHIDFLVITHDHYDHLDYQTIKDLRGRVDKVICALGVGAHFELWGYQPAQLIEKDWGDKVVLDERITLHLAPARHFSGRSIFSNNTLWTSYVLETPSSKIFLGGDSGYDDHFREIGNKFGGFDLAILENGQYNVAWKYIHAMPQDVLRAGKELKAKRIFPVHSGKFALAAHAWYEPLSRLTELNKTTGQKLITPMIGEVVHMDDEQQEFRHWWLGIK